MIELTPVVIECITLLMRHFHTEDKVVQWMNTSNLGLEGKTPIEICVYGREKQLLAFIRSSLC